MIREKGRHQTAPQDSTSSASRPAYPKPPQTQSPRQSREEGVKVENARNLVEEQGVAFVFNNLGTGHQRVQSRKKYLNAPKVPDLRRHRPPTLAARPLSTTRWTIGFKPRRYQGEARL